MMKHLPGSLGALLKQFAQFRLADHGEEDQMPMGKTRSALDDFRSRRCLRKVRKPHDETALLLKTEQRLGGALMVRLEFFVANLRQSFEQGANMARPVAGG